MKRFLVLTVSLSFLITLALNAQGVAQDSKCLGCHGAAAARQSSAPTIDTTVMKGSVHASLACADCHTIDLSKSHKGNRIVFCAKCHQKEAEGFSKSPHVAGRKANIEQLPTCITCHGSHEILAVSDPNARTNHKNSVKICITCHEDQKLTDKVAELPNPAMIKAYENSIHGKELMVKGNMKAPACVDCHGSHSFLPADEPQSPLFKTRIAETCGKCHGDIAAIYHESVHGTALAKGILESPTCTNCHGEHDILPPKDPKSHVYATNVSKTCSDCHASDKVVAKYGLKADRISTFQESFHGAAGALGDIRVANCASCHGYHGVFPQSDARSMINTANIEKTCGQCHEGLPADFAKGAVHTSASTKESGGEFYVRKFYYWFIPIIILGFIIYRVLEYKRRIKRVG